MGGPPASTLTYNPAGQLTSETLATDLSITNTYDELLRRSSLTLQPFNSFTLYTYDNASRLASVSDGTTTATFTYIANSPLVSQIAFTQSGQPRMTTTKQYDALNRLTSIVSLPQTPDAIPQTLSSAYDYNSANQRTRTTHADASYWIYQYDTLGPKVSGKRFWPDGTPVAGQQFEYGFDDIGNRQTAAPVGQASSLPVRAASLPPVPAPDVRGGRIGTRGTDAPPTGRQGCLPHRARAPAAAGFIEHGTRACRRLQETAMRPSVILCPFFHWQPRLAAPIFRPS